MGDGLVDLVGKGARLEIHANNGSGEFATAARIDVTAVGDASVAIGDLTGDGARDLAPALRRAGNDVVITMVPAEPVTII